MTGTAKDRRRKLALICANFEQRQSAWCKQPRGFRSKQAVTGQTVAAGIKRACRFISSDFQRKIFVFTNIGWVAENQIELREDIFGPIALDDPGAGCEPETLCITSCNRDRL